MAPWISIHRQPEFPLRSAVSLPHTAPVPQISHRGAFAHRSRWHSENILQPDFHPAFLQSCYIFQFFGLIFTHILLQYATFSTSRCLCFCFFISAVSSGNWNRGKLDVKFSSSSPSLHMVDRNRTDAVRSGRILVWRSIYHITYSKEILDAALKFGSVRRQFVI